MQAGQHDIPTATHAITTPQRLLAGWHRLRLSLTSQVRHGIRKQLHVSVGNYTDTLCWNERLHEDLVFHLDAPASEIRFTFRHAQGPLIVEQFRLLRVSQARATATAVSAKLNLLSQFNCLGPVVKRGGTLLLHGRFRDFGRKLMKGLPDSRVMKIETKRAEEATASWWRRRSATPEQLAGWCVECEAIDEPRPVAVILPVDATRVDHARQSVFSVLRQIYPHWQLRILWPNENVPSVLSDAIRREDRARIVTTSDGNLATSLQRAVADLPCEDVLILSPDDELAEQALLSVVQNRAATTTIQLSELAEQSPERMLTAVCLLKWVGTLEPFAPNTGDQVVFPLDAGLGANFKIPQPPVTRSIHLSANLVGISGWDAVAFQVLKGFTSVGIGVKRHPEALVRTHVLPPGLAFPEMPRISNDSQLIIAAPFQVKPFRPDDRTAILTMWECDRLDANSVRELNKARVVIVPSTWGRETFRASGVTVPIAVVPLGIDPLLYHPRSTSRDVGVTTLGLAGALGAGGVRKNMPLAIDAFRAAFPNETNVRLRVKITPNCPPLDLPEDDRIDIVRAVLPPSEVAAWYRSLSVYVNPSKAEGFGLHLLEAMACGVPVISTAVSGVADYFNDTVGWVLPHTTERVRNDYYDGHWFPPCRDSLIETFRKVHREDIAIKGIAAAARAKRFTWRDTGRQLLAVLKQYELLEELR
ncbi:hypothetical protein BH11PLA2_BH11PLA2_11400 [soil metagenome]